MAYVRKTVDTWELWTNYGQGWEHEVTELSWKEMREQKRTYRENCPGVVLRVKKRRERKDQQ